MKDEKSKNNKSKISWTKEQVIEESKKFSSRSQFKESSRSAYEYAKKHNLLDSFSWIPKNARRYWTEQRCIEVSKKYDSLKKFKDNDKLAYDASKKRGYLEKMTWLKNDLKTKWADKKEECIAIAKQYKTQKDFRKHEYSAYTAARNHGWFDELDKFLEKDAPSDPNDPNWLIYAYEFPNKHAYIGLSMSFGSRKTSHKTDKTDTVRLFCEDNRYQIPTPKVIKENLTSEEAQFYEDFYKKEYENSGWTTINRGQTGVGKSSLGGSIKKWSFEECKRVASQCESWEDIGRKYPGAYSALHRHSDWKDKIASLGIIPRDSNKTEIVQYDLNGKFVREFSSIIEASNSVNGNHANISAACNRRQHSSYGYIWRNKSDVLDESGNILAQIEITKPDKQPQPVYQLSLDGYIIKRFNSRREASEEASVHPGKLKKCLDGFLDSISGYRWKLERDLFTN